MNTSANQSAEPILTLGELAETVQRAKAELGEPPVIMDDGTAFRRLIESGGIGLFRVSEPAPGAAFFGVPVRTNRFIPRGFVFLRDSAGNLAVIDARTDEERAQDEARNG